MHVVRECLVVLAIVYVWVVCSLFEDNEPGKLANYNQLANHIPVERAPIYTTYFTVHKVGLWLKIGNIWQFSTLEIFAFKLEGKISYAETFHFYGISIITLELSCYSMQLLYI